MEINVIQFTKVNEDVYGLDEDVFVVVQMDGKLTQGHQKRLLAEIRNLQKNTPAEDWDTDTLVAEAMKAVFGTTCQWQFVVPTLYTIKF